MFFTITKSFFFDWLNSNCFFCLIFIFDPSINSNAQPSQTLKPDLISYSYYVVIRAERKRRSQLALTVKTFRKQKLFCSSINKVFFDDSCEIYDDSCLNMIIIIGKFICRIFFTRLVLHVLFFSYASEV